MGRRHSDLRFHHTVCVGCRLILCHNPSITPALGADDAFPRMCMLHKSRCLWLFFRVRRLSDLINPIRCSHTPFSQLLFSPVPIQLFWGLFHSSGNNIRSTLPKTLSSTIHLTRYLLSGGWGGFTRQSYEIILQKNGHFILTTPMWRSQDHFGNATFMLSVVALQRVSTFHGLFYALHRGASFCGSSHCPSLLSIKMQKFFRKK